jgi:hypothetical protein
MQSESIFLDEERMKIVRRIGIGLASIIILAQFIRPDMSPRTSNPEIGIHTAYPVPGDVDAILDRSCNDCHSNTTKYPWYSDIQPVGWWIQDHIDDARRHLNFDEFTSYRLYRQYNKFQEIEGEIREHLMPLDSYLPLHPEAELSTEDRSLIVQWSRAMRDSMRAWYPQDSLQRRRQTSESRPSE